MRKKIALAWLLRAVSGDDIDPTGAKESDLIYAIAEALGTGTSVAPISFDETIEVSAVADKPGEFTVTGTIAEADPVEFSINDQLTIESAELWDWGQEHNYTDTNLTIDTEDATEPATITLPDDYVTGDLRLVVEYLYNDKPYTNTYRLFISVASEEEGEDNASSLENS